MKRHVPCQTATVSIQRRYRKAQSIKTHRAALLPRTLTQLFCVSAKIPVDEESTWWNVRALRVLVDDDVAVADISMQDACFL